MPNHAHITIVGFVGRDAELAQAGEHQVARFSVATTRRRKTDPLTTWWNVTAWRQAAAFAGQNIKKGSLVLVSGEVYEDPYTKDGVVRKVLKIDADKVELLSRMDAPPGGSRDQQPSHAAAPAAGAGADDEPPF